MEGVVLNTTAFSWKIFTNDSEGCSFFVTMNEWCSYLLLCFDFFMFPSQKGQ
jgi:hypothetical protein